MKTVLIYSGGLDSTVLLYRLLTLQGTDSVKCLSVNYGQRHRKELVSARAICHDLGVEHQIADLSHLNFLFAGSSQTSPEIEVPEGHYEEESMKLTVVPNRNMVLLSLATAWAVSLKYDSVAYAAHAGDHAIYPDCRPEFTAAIARATEICDWTPIKLLRPFLDPVPMSKADIARLGADLKVPMHRTWSCYKGGTLHCGKCGTCVERREAFQLAGVPDQTIYEE